MQYMNGYEYQITTNGSDPVQDSKKFLKGTVCILRVSNFQLITTLLY